MAQERPKAHDTTGNAATASTRKTTTTDGEVPSDYISSILCTPFPNGRHAADLAGAFEAFRQAYVLGQADHFASLRKGQSPRSMILSCCDSRTDPALLFRCRPGDIFVHRAIASLVPPYGSAASACIRAATAYAVGTLGVEELVVLGHTGCGGMKALVDGCAGTPLNDWIGQAGPVLDLARKRFPGADRATLRSACERLGPVLSVENLRTYPWVAEGLARGKLALHAWLYDLQRGEIYVHSPERDRYEAVGARREDPFLPLAG